MAWPDRGAASQVYPSTAPAPAALDIGTDGQQQWLVQYSPHPTTPGLLLKQVLHAPQHAQVCKPHFQITWVLYCNLLCSMKQQLLCSLKLRTYRPAPHHCTVSLSFARCPQQSILLAAPLSARMPFRMYQVEVFCKCCIASIRRVRRRAAQQLTAEPA